LFGKDGIYQFRTGHTAKEHKLPNI
jgi:hypothetical protein